MLRKPVIRLARLRPGDVDNGPDDAGADELEKALAAELGAEGPQKINGGFFADAVAADGITLPLLRKEQALEKKAQPAPPPLQQQERHDGHARVDVGGDARGPDIAHRAGRAVGGGNFLAHQKEAPPCEGEKRATMPNP